MLGNITFWHDNRGVCWGTEVSACGKVGCLQTKIALSQFSLCVPVSSMRGKNKEIGGCDRKGELDSEVWRVEEGISRLICLFPHVDPPWGKLKLSLLYFFLPMFFFESELLLLTPLSLG